MNSAQPSLERLLHLPRGGGRRPRDRRARRRRRLRPHRARRRRRRRAPATTPVAQQQPAADGSVADIYADAAPAVASIDNGNGGSGSGFLMDGQGHVVTNQHVVDGGSEFTVRFGEDGEALRRQARRRGPLDRPRGARGRLRRRPGRDQAARARLVRRPAPGRRGDRDRQPVRPLRQRHDRHHLRARPRHHRAQRLPDRRRRCRPTRRSTPATRAARCSTPRAA